MDPKQRLCILRTLWGQRETTLLLFSYAVYSTRRLLGTEKLNETQYYQEFH